MHILLADDEPLIRGVIAALLRTCGHGVAEAASGIELLDRLGDWRFDLIVTDVEMGWVSGVHALASARAAGLVTPAIVMSGNAGTELDAVLGRLGRATFLAKPFLLDELLAAVAAVDPAAEARPLVTWKPAEARA